MQSKNIYFSDESFSSKNKPGFDIAISRTLLDQVSLNQYPSVLRVYKGTEQIAFGPSDVRNDGYDSAVSYLKKKKFSAVNRLTGGHAVIFHPGTLIFGWMFHDLQARLKMHYYFELVSNFFQSIINDFGLNCFVGEVDGEYCSGQYSLNLDKKVKVAGIAQRIVNRAVYIGGFIAINNSDLIKEMLIPIYKDLGIKWDPQTVGALNDYDRTIDFTSLSSKISYKLHENYNVHELLVNQDILQNSKKNQDKYAV
ncbi:MAG: hypothetical protein CL779_02990 [Chloroflexi bacterium]|nr:hypothetical protein [Chloroflexota bacterium]|tara:strand:+ start:9117 stop:9875 length:759 start_codon:yes stop_codon:yes gene_type:complete